MNFSNHSYRYQGGALSFDDPTYVYRQADTDLYQKLVAGEFCYILTSRQMGKSSLRVRTQQRLEEQGIQCVSIDLSAMGHVSLAQWYRGITYHLFKNLKVPQKPDWKAWWVEHEFLAPIQQLRELIDEVILDLINQRIVIFFDEIDTVLGLEFQADDFFALIRSCYNQKVDDTRYQRLTFCLLGVASPSDLISNKRCTPFNIGTAIELTGFQFQEAKEGSMSLFQ